MIRKETKSINFRDSMINDPSTRTTRTTFDDNKPWIKRKLKNRSIILCQSDSGDFNMFFRLFDAETAKNPRCAHKTERGKVSVTRISLSREALECLVMNALEAIAHIDYPDQDHEISITINHKNNEKGS